MIAAQSVFIIAVSLVLFVFWAWFVYRSIRRGVHQAVAESDKIRHALLGDAQKGKKQQWNPHSTGSTS